MSKKIQKIICIPVIAVLVFSDQIFKHLAERALAVSRTSDFIPHIIQFRYSQNTGASFGVFQNKTIALSIVTSIVLIMCLVLLFSGKITRKIEYTALLLVTAGGIGNLIDRVFRHYVVDYLEFLFMDFAIFNFADILITCGGVLYIISFIYTVAKETKQKKIHKSGAENG